MDPLTPIELEILSTLSHGPETSATIHPDFCRRSNQGVFSDEARALEMSGLEAIYVRLRELGLTTANYSDHDGYERAVEGEQVTWWSLTDAGWTELDNAGQL